MSNIDSEIKNNISETPYQKGVIKVFFILLTKIY